TWSRTNWASSPPRGRSRVTGRGWRRRPRSSRLGRAAPRLRAPRRRHRRRSRREGGVRVEVKAVARYVRISPRKVRPVMALIKGKAVDEALAVLRFSPNRASREVAKVVQSAAANAENNLELARTTLTVARAYVDSGPSQRRMQARARGRADVIKKRSSHITVVVQGE